MSAKFYPYMHGAPYIFHFVHPLVKLAKMMVERVNFERNLKNIRPATVLEMTVQQQLSPHFLHVSAAIDFNTKKCCCNDRKYCCPGDRIFCSRNTNDQCCLQLCNFYMHIPTKSTTFVKVALIKEILVFLHLLCQFQKFQ